MEAAARELFRRSEREGANAPRQRRTSVDKNIYVRARDKDNSRRVSGQQTVPFYPVVKCALTIEAERHSRALKIERFGARGNQTRGISRLFFLPFLSLSFWEGIRRNGPRIPKLNGKKSRVLLLVFGGIFLGNNGRIVEGSRRTPAALICE